MKMIEQSQANEVKIPDSKVSRRRFTGRDRRPRLLALALLVMALLLSNGMRAVASPPLTISGTTATQEHSTNTYSPDSTPFNIAKIIGSDSFPANADIEQLKQLLAQQDSWQYRTTRAQAIGANLGKWLLSLAPTQGSDGQLPSWARQSLKEAANFLEGIRSFYVDDKESSDIYLKLALSLRTELANGDESTFRTRLIQDLPTLGPTIINAREQSESLNSLIERLKDLAKTVVPNPACEASQILDSVDAKLNEAILDKFFNALISNPSACEDGSTQIAERVGLLIGNRLLDFARIAAKNSEPAILNANRTATLLEKIESTFFKDLKWHEQYYHLAASIKTPLLNSATKDSYTSQFLDRLKTLPDSYRESENQEAYLTPLINLLQAISPYSPWRDPRVYGSAASFFVAITIWAFLSRRKHKNVTQPEPNSPPPPKHFNDSIFSRWFKKPGQKGVLENEECLKILQNTQRLTQMLQEQQESDGKELGRVSDEVRKLGQDLTSLSERIDGFDQRLGAIPAVKPVAVTHQTAAPIMDFNKIRQAVNKDFQDTHRRISDQSRHLQALENKFHSLQNSLKGPKQAFPDLDALERKALQSAWEVQHRQEAILSFKKAAQSGQWGGRFAILRRRLPECLDGAPTLREALRGLIAPVEQVSLFQTKLGVIERALTEVDSGHAWSIFQYRDLALHLSLLLDTEEGRRLQKFKLEEWVREKFRGFADSFYRELWRRQLEGRWEELQSCEATVDEVLSWGHLKAIPITPGETRFDSQHHIGRSTTSSADYPEGVIVSVVRTGFRDLKTGNPLQAPEVIVNRR